jgi:putative sugar O-methyltransferase
VGKPPCIEIGGRRVSQDMLNSVLEYGAIKEGRALGPAPVVMEIGAGSGRTAYCFLKLLPRARYIVVDVPPALFIAQYFLSSQFGERRIFTFRPFRSYAEIANEFEAADIVFLMPHQLEAIDKADVDVCIAIDCLHEMTQDRVEYYFRQASRLAHNIYFKCWLNTSEPADGIRWSADTYPVPPGWRKAYQRTCAVPAEYFEAYFHIPR